MTQGVTSSTHSTPCRSACKAHRKFKRPRPGSPGCPSLRTRAEGQGSPPCASRRTWAGGRGPSTPVGERFIAATTHPDGRRAVERGRSRRGATFTSYHARPPRHRRQMWSPSSPRRLSNAVGVATRSHLHQLPRTAATTPSADVVVVVTSSRRSRPRVVRAVQRLLAQHGAPPVRRAAARAALGDLVRLVDASQVRAHAPRVRHHRDELHPPAALRTLEHVDRERAREQLGPEAARASSLRLLVGLGFGRGVARYGRLRARFG